MTQAIERSFTRLEVEALIIEALRSQNTTPRHIHHCLEGHDWTCSSPYCEDVTAVPRNCVEHGGPAPIMKGQEPGRFK